MTHAVLLAGTDLAETLEAENAALEALDMPRAIAVFPLKAERAKTLRAALSGPPARDAAELAAGLACAERLRVLGERNRALLERAMFVQGRLIATLARAAPRSPHAYSRAPEENARIGAMALSARV